MPGSHGHRNPSRETPPGSSDSVAVGKEREEDVIALLTTGLLLLPAVAVGAVLAWAESRARRGATTVLEPRLTRALLAVREDEGFRSVP